MSPILSLSNEIWFIPLHKLNELKFLCRQFRTIVTLSPLNDRLDRYRIDSHRIFNMAKLYVTVTAVYDNFLRRLKYYFSFPTICYLKYRLQFINNDILPSNVLLHLLNCPRSEFAQNDCKYCSLLPPPDNFKCRLDFYTSLKLLYRKVSPTVLFNDSVLPLFEKYSIKRFDFTLSFRSREHLEVVNSERKRCIEIFVCDSPCKMILAYCEVFLRILLNFLWSLSDDFKSGKKRFFLDVCLLFVKDLFWRVTPLMNSSFCETNAQKGTVWTVWDGLD